MGQFNLTITYPDGKANDILEALVWDQPSGFADPNAPTGAEARSVVNGLIVEQLKDIYRRHQKHLLETGQAGNGGITE